MAIRVPAQQTQINPLGTPNVRLPQGPSQARGVSQGLREASASAQRVEDSIVEARIQLQVKRNTERVLAAQQTFEDWRRGFDTQVRTDRRGHNASGVVDFAQTEVENQFATLTDSLENDAQREAFKQSMAPRRGQYLDSLASYEAQQLEVALTEREEASIEDWVDYAAANPQSPDAVALAREGIVAAQNDLSRRKKGRSIDPENENSRAHFLELSVKLSRMYRQGFENLLSNPEQARAFFDRYKDDINAREWERYEVEIEQAETIVQAQQAFDERLARITAGEISFEEARAEIRGAMEGRPREQAIALLDAQESRTEQLRTRTQAAANEAAWDAFDRNGRVVTSRISQALNSADPQTRLAIQNAQKTAEDQRLNNWPAYWNIWDQMREDPEAFAYMTIRNDNLSVSQFQDLRERQLRIRQALESGDEDGIATLLTDTQRLQIKLDELGIEDPAVAGGFKDAVDARVRAESISGVDMNPQREQEIIDEVGTSFTWDRSIFFPGGFGEESASAFELLRNQDQFDSFVKHTDNASDIIDDERLGFIIERLEFLGEDTTKANILRLHLQGVAAGY